MDGEWRDDRWRRIVHRARLDWTCDCDGDQYAGCEQSRDRDDHGGDANDFADDFLCFGELQSFDRGSQRDITMHRNRAGDGKL